MPRVRHEARLRWHEHRREVRKKFWKEFREAFTKKLKEEFFSRYKEYIERGEKLREMIRLMAEFARGRGIILFKTIHYDIPKKVMEVVAFDKYVMSLPEDLRNLLSTVFVEIARSRYISKALLEKYPELVAIVKHLIMKFGRFPCKHNAFAIKLTPVTIHYFKGFRVTYYVLRFAPVDKLRPDPYIASSKPIDIYFIAMGRRKPGSEFVNSMRVVGSGSADMFDEVYYFLNETRNRYIKVRVMDYMLRPHIVKLQYAKSAGRLEEVYSYGHCSIFAIFEPFSPRVMAIETGNWFIMRKRPRWKVKLFDYWLGLRV